MTSKEAQKVFDMLVENKNLDEILNTPLEEQRRMWEEYAAAAKIPEGIRIIKEKINDIDVEWLIPEKGAMDQVIVYFHGGGLNQGSIITHRKLCAYVALYTGKRVLVHDYPLAPEHPYPAALNASTGLYLTLLMRGFDSEKIIFGSDSSGSTLSLATMLQLRDQKEPLPGASFHFSPMIDYSLSGESLEERKDREPQLFIEDLEMTADFYCEASVRKEPYVSPVFGDFTGFPPMLIHVGSEEMLWSDAERLAQQSKDNGVHVAFKSWEGLWHVFQSKAETVPESRESLKETAIFLKEIKNNQM